MYPGYKSGSHVLTFNLVAATSLFAHPGQVCIVANRFVPELDGAPTLIKRILAGPGDSVEFRRGGIFVNGGGTGYASSGNSESTLLLSAQQYFVVGDNADYSMDSRNFGPVKGSDLLGIVIFHF
jgi:signal peptidase I